MKNITKIWLIVASCLVSVGLIICISVMTLYKWDISRLSTIKYSTEAYEVHEPFQKIIIKADAENVMLVPAVDGKAKVECVAEKNTAHTVNVDNEILTVETTGGRQWHDHIGIMGGNNAKITVHLPQKEYGELVIRSNAGDIDIPKEFKFAGIDIEGSVGDIKNQASATGLIKINTSTGVIRADGATAGGLEVSNATGDVIVSGVVCENDIKISIATGEAKIADSRCKNIFANGDLGKAYLKNTIAEAMLTVEVDSGDVELLECDAAEIFASTALGDITGSLLSDKIFIAKSNLGDVDVPETTTGGKCKLSTDVGNIRIKIKS